MKRRTLLNAGALLTLALGSGCATNRGILDLKVARAETAATGSAVKIVRVTDNRVFDRRPTKPSVPSLKDGQTENKAITLRAVARKRNTYGKALGDILLPEGRTVEQLAGEAVARAFGEAGFAVLTEGQEGYQDASAVEADIEQFWGWFTPGFWAIKLEFEARVKITGPVNPFEQGETVRGYVRIKKAGAATNAWNQVFAQGITSFIENVKKRLRGEPAGE